MFAIGILLAALTAASFITEKVRKRALGLHWSLALGDIGENLSLSLIHI